jgi:hypothetical protein
MADTKISALAAASALAGTETIPGVQSGGNVKITPAQILAYATSDAASTVRTTRNAAQSFTLNGSGVAANTFPVPSVRPVTAAKNIAFDVVPSAGAASISGYGYAWLDICSADIQEAAGAVQCAHLAIRSDFAEISMRAFSAAGDESTTKLPIVFGVGGDTDVTECFRSRTDGRFQFGSANIVANGSVATAMSSVGPTGARTTIQKWFRIYDNSGNPFYVPAW